MHSPVEAKIDPRSNWKVLADHVFGFCEEMDPWDITAWAVAETRNDPTQGDSFSDGFTRLTGQEMSILDGDDSSDTFCVTEQSTIKPIDTVMFFIREIIVPLLTDPPLISLIGCEDTKSNGFQRVLNEMARLLSQFGEHDFDADISRGSMMSHWTHIMTQKESEWFNLEQAHSAFKIWKNQWTPNMKRLNHHERNIRILLETIYMDTSFHLEDSIEIVQEERPCTLVKMYDKRWISHKSKSSDTTFFSWNKLEVRPSSDIMADMKEGVSVRADFQMKGDVLTVLRLNTVYQIHTPEVGYVQCKYDTLFPLSLRYLYASIRWEWNELED
ncbi:hypothetical protein PROFUN_07575 [Planoprotostelium fungivorum]|uniref:Uncharacterized protein n=1 Tax=Planoprotostelium fungivorum TaxID=1890364 RepID=A0A2P6NLT1_9EUKA|nr:hypothetical protein PROFUN_07575 [Planoprotostelium fungivorum]